jgi:hypothetical protein
MSNLKELQKQNEMLKKERAKLKKIAEEKKEMKKLKFENLKLRNPKKFSFLKKAGKFAKYTAKGAVAGSKVAGKGLITAQKKLQVSEAKRRKMGRTLSNDVKNLI